MVLSSVGWVNGSCSSYQGKVWAKGSTHPWRRSPVSRNHSGRSAGWAARLREENRSIFRGHRCHRAEIVVSASSHCAIVVPMHEMPCSTPGCSRRVPADSKIHRIVLHDPGTRVLGVLYYCSPCLAHFASYGPYGHFAPRYESTPTTSHQSMAEWSAWVDQLLEEDI
jgi:hypothetical protein